MNKNIYTLAGFVLLFLATLISDSASAQICFASTSTQNATCNGLCNGTATVTPWVFRPAPFTFLWNNGQTTQTATGLCAGNYTVSVTDGNGCTSSNNVTINQPQAINATTTQNNPQCYGQTGSATINVSGGGTYTYSWSTNPVQTTQTATGLTAGTYTVVATNSSSGCTVTRTVTISQPPQILGEIAITPADCGQSNGSITINNLSGGTGNITVTWNTNPVQTGTTASNLSSGTYTATATDQNNCSISVPITVPNIGGPVLTTSSTNVSCSGGDNGTATVTATTGTSPFTYLWDTEPVQTTQTATGLEPGNYSVTVTDAQGCFTSTTVAVVEQPPVSISTTQVVNISCNGGTTGSITVDATGGNPPYYFSWNTNPPQSGQTASGLAIGDYTVTVVDAFSCFSTATISITQAEGFSTSTDINDLSCNGAGDGSVMVTVSGGNQPYTYSWNTNPEQTTETATGLSAGSYTVTITDFTGCVTTAGANVTEPPAINLSASATSSSCGQSSGIATATASGGNGVLSYSWDTNPEQTTATATGLAAGNYTVTVTDESDCEVTATVTVTAPGGPSATTTHTNVSCNGGNNGTATVNATGGTPPYSYLWTPGNQTTQTATGLAAGVYTVTVTGQANCTTTSNVTITQPGVINISINKQDVLCNGGSSGSATATVTGGAGGYTYSWDTNPVQTTASISGLAAGTYTLTVTDANGCTATQSATITEPALLEATTLQNHVSCNGGNNGAATVNPTGGVQPYTYSWNTTPVQTTQTATGLVAGTYTSTITDTNGCVITKQVTITEPDELTATVSTTPEDCGQVNGSATVSTIGGTGELTYLWDTDPAQTTAAATDLASGSYTVTVTDENACTVSVSTDVPNAGGLAVQVSKTNVSCNGGNNGTATLVVSGGTGPYEYAWNTNPVQTTQSATGLTAGTYTATVTDAVGCIFTVSVNITQPTAFTVSASQQNILCNGQQTGSATATAAGGVTPYIYSWNTQPVQTTASITQLAAGTYTASVTDANGCTASATVNITQPSAPLAATTVKTNVSCFGGNNGAATTNPTGGTTPYSYSWNTVPVQTGQTAFGLPAGTFTVLITDANGCTLSRTVTITQPAVLAATASVNGATCNQADGDATLTATGGTGVYTYLWNTNPAQTDQTATGLAAGSYSVTVTDENSCTTTVTTTVSNTNAATLQTDQQDISCHGAADGTATVSATGGTGNLTYSWNTNPAQTTETATGLDAGDYTVTVTDEAGCQSLATVVITEPTETPYCFGTFSDPSCVGCADGTISIIAGGGTPGYLYLWSPTGQTTAAINNLPAGVYCVNVTDANGCFFDSCYTLTDPIVTGVNGLEKEISLTIYPNPAGQDFTLEMELNTEAEEHITIYLYTATGNLLMNEERKAGDVYKERFDISLYSPGIYFFSVNTQGQYITKRIIKR